MRQKPANVAAKEMAFLEPRAIKHLVKKRQLK